jgi:hypothetical protein
VVKPIIEKNGYLRVRIRRDGQTVAQYIHRLVLETYSGPAPGHARHLNDDKRDNRIENLAWGTPKQNGADKVRHGTQAKGQRNGNSKLTEAIVRGMRDLRTKGVALADIASDFGVSLSLVSQVARGVIWTHVPVLEDPGRYRLTAAGRRSGHAKLTEDQVRAIRLRYDARESPRAIALDFAVIPTTVIGIGKHRVWSSLAEAPPAPVSSPP